MHDLLTLMCPSGVVHDLLYSPPLHPSPHPSSAAQAEKIALAKTTQLLETQKSELFQSMDRYEEGCWEGAGEGNGAAEVGGAGETRGGRRRRARMRAQLGGDTGL